MKKGKIILAVLLIAVIGSLSYGFYLYNKPTKDIKNEKAEHVVNAKELVNEFTKDAQSMTDKYVGKVIEIKGKISLIESGNKSKIVILNEGVKCEFNDLGIVLEQNQEITVKGVFSGFDDMFNELSLVKCYLIK